MTEQNATAQNEAEQSQKQDSGTQDSSQNPAAAQNANKPDPAFFTCVNEYLELTNKQSKQYGFKRISMTSLYAAARFNTHVYLATVGANAARERTDFFDYMTQLYRRMLNEHLDGLGAERGIDVGESELAAENAAAAAAANAAGPVPPPAPAAE